MNSPWLSQLHRTRPIASLEHDHTVDVTVLGGGIAGVVTSYFLLRDTDKKVLLLEGDKIGHGATGHNAGQVTSYFERPFFEIVEEFGLELASQGQTSIHSAWMLLEEIVEEAHIQTPLWQVTGYAGLSSMDLILEHLKNNALKEQGGILFEPMYIADTVDIRLIPKEFSSLYSVLPHNDILDLLETKNAEYIATLVSRKGCMNSALFCEELVTYMLNQYSDRFVLAEHSFVEKIILGVNDIQANTKNWKVSSRYLVLCTNGFENFSLVYEKNPEIEKTFHKMIHGTVGYMLGYLDPINKQPSVVSYLDRKIAETGDEEEPDTYYYLTRRPFENEKKEKHNLVSVGGPDARIPEYARYAHDQTYPSECTEDILSFLYKTYAFSPQNIEPKFKWHGLMGYTPNSIRRVGPDPQYPFLMYNLGCNGVGILPSIFGGKRISRYIVGEDVEASIFDIPRE